MKHRLMDLLACPLDKSWPLELEIIEETKENEAISLPMENPKTGVVCGFYCNYKQYMLVTNNDQGEEITKNLDAIGETVTLEDCKQCFQIEIQSGNILCKTDEEHKYKIKEGIPVMLSQEKIEEIYGKRKRKN